MVKAGPRLREFELAVRLDDLELPDGRRIPSTPANSTAFVTDPATRSLLVFMINDQFEVGFYIALSEADARKHIEGLEAALAALPAPRKDGVE